MQPFQHFSQKYITMCRMAEEVTDYNMIRQEGDIKYYKYEPEDFLYIQGKLTQNKYSDWSHSVYTGPYKCGDGVAWIPTFIQLLDLYKELADIKTDSMALLWLSNYIEDQVTKDHSFCLKYETKEEIFLLFIQETCHGKKWSGEKWIPII